MYLYEKDNNKINVFNFTPNKEDILNYKKKYMNKANVINDEDKVLTAYSNYAKPLENCETGDLIILKSIKHELEDRNYHRLAKCNEMDGLYNYFDGSLEGSKAIKVINDNKMYAYLLLTQNSYQVDYQMYKMDGIINLPKKLYLLYLLENEKFSLLQGEDIKEVLKLYNVSDYPIDTFNNSCLSRLESTGLIDISTYENVCNKVNDTTKILKKIRS